MVNTYSESEVEVMAQEAINRFIEQLQGYGLDIRHADADVDSADPAEWAAAAVIAWHQREWAK